MAQVKVEVIYHPDADKAEVDRLIADYGHFLIFYVRCNGVGKQIMFRDGSFLSCIDKTRAREEGISGVGKAIIVDDELGTVDGEIDREYVIVGNPRTLFTEAEWLACNDTRALGEFLCGKTSDRKLRLFAVACCRWMWHEMSRSSIFKSIPRPPECVRISSERLPERVLKAVEVAERFADGKATREELAKARDTVPSLFSHGTLPGGGLRWWDYLPMRAWSATADSIDAEPGISRYGATDAFIFRDIFGNPFRPVTVNPSWLTANVLAIAQRIYDERRCRDMPILGDALEDTGCDNASILEHCRSGGEHVRGCWVVDLLLGKQ
jgi:hypothetical protein